MNALKTEYEKSRFQTLYFAQNQERRKSYPQENITYLGNSAKKSIPLLIFRWCVKHLEPSVLKS